MNTRVRTRFAPSPTGPLHMGGVRTALYNYLFAKKSGGDFLLRIEDTDQNRFVEGAEQYIVDALNWCGIKIDEGVSVGGPYEPYRQSERKNLGIYRDYAEQLVRSGHAYYAFDTAEDLENMRKRLTDAGNAAPTYNFEVRHSMINSISLSTEDYQSRISAGVPHVIRLKVMPGETIVLHDMIRGEVSFTSDIVDDKVLLKSDGMPTYHLAHIIDDVLMEITHAIRGEEWLPSAPAHLLIYKWLGWEDRMPRYAHLPLLLKPEGNGKLSKRDGDRLGFPVFPLQWMDPATGEISSGYREKGYYPAAFVNMLALLGWNPGTEQELFTLEELTHAFTMDHVHKAGARFDPEKTKWFNEQYLRQKPASEIAKNIAKQVAEQFHFAETDHRVTISYLEKAVELLRDRVQFEQEMPETGKYLFVAPTGYDETVVAKKWKPALLPFFEGLVEGLGLCTPFLKGEIDVKVKECASTFGVKPGEIMQLLRVLVSGQGGGVDLIGMMELLGKEEGCKRIAVGQKS
ncbi:MAG: glutamate--tRNA ligase, partial [Bacteroidia bacterium]